jgi:hypothetical protein
MFGANQATELEQAQQMASSLNNLANATIQKNTTIKNLVATNATLIKAIANIQLSITQMCATSIATSPTLTVCPLDQILCLPLSLEQHQTCLGQGLVLLDAWLQGQGWPLQHNMLITQDWPSVWRNPGKNHGWQYSQHWIPHPHYTLYLTECTSGSSFHHHY